jgi:hypothetical protein
MLSSLAGGLNFGFGNDITAKLNRSAMDLALSGNGCAGNAAEAGFLLRRKYRCLKLTIKGYPLNGGIS